MSGPTLPECQRREGASARPPTRRFVVGHGFFVFYLFPEKSHERPTGRVQLTKEGGWPDGNPGSCDGRTRQPRPGVRDWQVEALRHRRDSHSRTT